MSVSKLRRIGGLALVAATATVLTSVVGVGVASAGGGGNIGPCPSSIANLVAAPNVGASFTTDSTGTTSSYTFSSWTAETQTAKVIPGLVEYCVYATQPKSGHSVTTFKFVSGSKNFGFVRPGGDKTNLPLDGSTIPMGTATWNTGTAPTSQTLVLHINDPAVCASLYGGTATTCFVLPSPKPGPVCDGGNTSLAYNAIPTDVVNCAPPALGFEATGTNEFGDQVALAGTARNLVNLKVVFDSFACESGGHWYDTGCTTTPGAVFSQSVMAKIYASDGVTVLATDTQTFNIPFRPSADPGCANPTQWRNTVTNECHNAIATVLEFNTWTKLVPALDDTVVWTVQFNTSGYGYSPLGYSNPCNSDPQGCAYDSLNVGTMSYTGAPYAGTDVSEDVAYISTGNPAGALGSTTGWTGNRPLGSIATS